MYLTKQARCLAAVLAGFSSVLFCGCGDQITAPVVAAERAAAERAEPTPTSEADEPKPTEPKPAEKPASVQRPKADRTPTRPGDAEKITFEDIVLGMEADMVFRRFLLTDRAKELDGKRVSISGFMHGAVEAGRQRNIKEFILLRNKECKFGPGGQADHLAQVFLEPKHTTEFTLQPVKVEGTLKIEPYEGSDGNTWSIYRLEDARVK